MSIESIIEVLAFLECGEGTNRKLVRECRFSEEQAINGVIAKMHSSALDNMEYNAFTKFQVIGA